MKWSEALKGFGFDSGLGAVQIENGKIGPRTGGLEYRWRGRDLAELVEELSR